MLAETLVVLDLLGESSQLLKVDEAIHHGLVALVQEGQVLLDDGEERDEGPLGGTLELTVLGHIVERVHVAHQILQRENSHKLLTPSDPAILGTSQSVLISRVDSL